MHVIQTNDLNAVTPAPTPTPTPQANLKSTTSPLSSCSNSPSSVRINQNYDPNNIKKLPTNQDDANDAAHGNTDADCDLDNSEDADSKPLLNATDNTQIVPKRTNNLRYDAADQKSAAKVDSDDENENETLITISHN